MVEQAYCELIVDVGEVPEALLNSASRGQSLARHSQVARFAGRCHPVRGFEGESGEGRPPLEQGRISLVLALGVAPTGRATAHRPDYRIPRCYLLVDHQGKSSGFLRIYRWLGFGDDDDHAMVYRVWRRTDEIASRQTFDRCRRPQN